MYVPSGLRRVQKKHAFMSILRGERGGLNYRYWDDLMWRMRWRRYRLQVHMEFPLN